VVCSNKEAQKRLAKSNGTPAMDLGHMNVVDDDCFYDHSWRNNVVIAFGTLSSFCTYLHFVSGVVCVVCPFAG